jgi:hypothetical protein
MSVMILSYITQSLPIFPGIILSRGIGGGGGCGVGAPGSRVQGMGEPMPCSSLLLVSTSKKQATTATFMALILLWVIILDMMSRFQSALDYSQIKLIKFECLCLLINNIFNKFPTK